MDRNHEFRRQVAARLRQVARGYLTKSLTAIVKSLLNHRLGNGFVTFGMYVVTGGILGERITVR